MAEAAPSSPFEMPEPCVLLEFLIVALDPPAHLGNINELPEGVVSWKRREPVFDRLLLTIGPFDQEPLLRPGGGAPSIPMCSTHAQAGKSRGQPLRRPLPPRDLAPSPCRQAKRKLFDRGRVVVVVAAHQLRWCAPTPPFFR